MPSSLAISVTYLLLLLSLASAVSAQIWKAGHATRYGPYASNPAESEQGYLPNEVGVGCSTGIVGNDPRWNAIVAGGTYTNPTNPNTVWPKRPTVAVSEAAYPSKSRICYKTLKIRASGVKNAPIIDADVVDFCPAAKCNWPRKELAFNVDVYGEYTWKALGGKDGGGKLKVEIAWPADVTPAPIPDGIGAPETPVTVDPTDAPTQPLDDESAEGGLSKGAIAGIVISCVAVSLAFTFWMWAILRKKRRPQTSPMGGPAAAKPTVPPMTGA